MEKPYITINVYDKRNRSTSNIFVVPLAENKFRMYDNDIFNCKLTAGTEFETRINKEGAHEIVKITKESEFTTRRFFLSSDYSLSDYELLGQELTQRGGFWQVDFGGIATINIPKDFEYNIDEVMKSLNLNLTEIVNDSKEDQ